MKQLKIVVLCGGLSTERNISFLTGSRVCQALRSRGHKAVLADLFMGFEEMDNTDRGGSASESAFDPEILFEDLPPIPEYTFDGTAPDLDAVRRSRKWKSPSLFGLHVLEVCRAADIVFIALHGKNGEDGRVQAAFDMMGIPYTGSGHLASAMSMDKIVTKMIVARHDVLTPAFHRWEFEEKGSEPEAREKFIRTVCRQTAVPCVVKTPEGGSSVGVYIVRRKEELREAVRNCMYYGNTFMTEQFIEGRDFTCAVLCGRALPSVEIVPKTRFYDYSNKYEAGATIEICPGRVTPETEEKMGEIALRVHEIMGLRTYSRSDFVIDKKGRIWFIEVNTLPGMTKTSLVPQEAAAVGIGYEELCEMIVEDGLRFKPQNL